MGTTTTRDILPPLESGDRLTRVEFERRYRSMSENVKAELIDGVVYVASPVKITHGRLHGLVGTWLGTYSAETPGTEMVLEATLRLDEANEPQPDAALRLLPEAGGSSWVDDEDYLKGSVELLVEVAASSASYDLHQKKETYRRHKVQEYLVLVVHSAEAHAFHHQDGDYVLAGKEADGILRSRRFPGLWLDVEAFFARDAAQLLATLRRGLASASHGEFVKSLHE